MNVKLVLAIGVVLAAALVGYRLGGTAGRVAVAHAETRASKAETALANARTDATNKARAQERAHADALAALAEQYEKDKANAEAQHDRIVAGLQSGALRLHNRWAACQATGRVSATAAGAGQPDAGAADRNESAARIVRAAAECDAQVSGLQRVIRADRE